jgi:hypothetical protein
LKKEEKKKKKPKKQKKNRKKNGRFVSSGATDGIGKKQTTRRGTVAPERHTCNAWSCVGNDEMTNIICFVKHDLSCVIYLFSLCR